MENMEYKKVATGKSIFRYFVLRKLLNWKHNKGKNKYNNYVKIEFSVSMHEKEEHDEPSVQNGVAKKKRYH